MNIFIKPSESDSEIRIFDNYFKLKTLSPSKVKREKKIPRQIFLLLYYAPVVL